MILIDTSAWVEFLRDTGSAVCNRVDALLDDEIATCHPVRMEVLAGARDEQHLKDLEGCSPEDLSFRLNLRIMRKRPLFTVGAAGAARPCAK